MEFRDWLDKEEEQDFWICWICTAYAHSSGQHAYGDSPEQPAGNCYENVEWELQYKQFKDRSLAERLLQGSTVYADDHSFSSYHQCQVSFNLSVIVRDEEVARQLEKMAVKDEYGEIPIHRAGPYDKPSGASLSGSVFK